eukprot:1137363-Pelagomonas_calceolata.AAC.3
MLCLQGRKQRCRPPGAFLIVCNLFIQRQHPVILLTELLVMLTALNLFNASKQTDQKQSRYPNGYQFLAVAVVEVLKSHVCRA